MTLRIEAAPRSTPSDLLQSDSIVTLLGRGPIELEPWFSSLPSSLHSSAPYSIPSWPGRPTGTISKPFSGKPPID